MTTIPPDTVYYADRAEHGTVIYARRGTKTPRQILHLRYHSPSGLEWGYGGSGPADTALAILADYLQEAPRVDAWLHTGRRLGDGRTLSVRLHQAFKFEIVAHLPYERWELPATRIALWLAAHRRLQELGRLGGDA